MSRSLIRDLLLLTSLCWATYGLGLTTHGLTNWQEAQRAMVAREMQQRGDWIVPTVDGQPYLAKPPMMYWAQLALAETRGARTGEFELRLTVALAGWIGVLLTYVVGRRMEQAGATGQLSASGPRPPGEASWWAALFLATGLLYVRSSRVGELDILLVPFTVLAIGAVHAAWRSHLDRQRLHLGAVAVAVLAACGAMLTKGPPGLLAIAMGAYGGVALWYGRGGEQRPLSRATVVAMALCALAMMAAAVAGRSAPIDLQAGLGLLLYGLLGALLGWFVGGLLNVRNAKQTFLAYARTHPLAVLGLPFVALWGWGQLVAARIGPEALDLAVRTEAADNLRAFMMVSPLRNIAAASYGAGLGSLAALGAGIWLVSRRVRLTPELAILVAWVAGGLIAFSVLGKGVARYLTPVWPGLALLGGMWWARTLPSLPRPHWIRSAAVATVIILAAVQTWWYGWGREWYNPDRSPRAFITELLLQPGVDAGRLAMLDFDTAAIAYYAGRTVPTWNEISRREAEALAKRGESLTLLLRESDYEQMDSDAGVRNLKAAGFALERLPLQSSFQIDHMRSEVIAVRFIPPSAATSPPAPPAASDPPE